MGRTQQLGRRSPLFVGLTVIAVGSLVLLSQVLRWNSGDVEAHLMLATLYRHTERREKAIGQLRVLERLADAERWREEIRAERGLLNESEQASVEMSAQDSPIATPEADESNNTITESRRSTAA